MRADHGIVVTFTPPGACVASHERIRDQALARRLAALHSYDYAGEYDATLRERPIYFVPHRTLIGTGLARRLGIHSTRDFFGGLVSHPILASKAIMHGSFFHALTNRKLKQPST